MSNCSESLAMSTTIVVSPRAVVPRDVAPDTFKRLPMPVAQIFWHDPLSFSFNAEKATRKLACILCRIVGPSLRDTSELLNGAEGTTDMIAEGTCVRVGIVGAFPLVDGSVDCEAATATVFLKIATAPALPVCRSPVLSGAEGSAAGDRVARADGRDFTLTFFFGFVTADLASKSSRISMPASSGFSSSNELCRRLCRAQGRSSSSSISSSLLGGPSDEVS